MLQANVSNKIIFALMLCVFLIFLKNDYDVSMANNKSLEKVIVSQITCCVWDQHRKQQ